jgi:carbon-monoxide dehydrogenase medium subunit
MVAQSRNGRRVILAVDFFAGIMTTTLEDDELLVKVHLPLLPPDTRFGFYEFSRRAGDFAIAMALVTYRIEDGRMVEPRLGVGGAEPVPRRIAEAEALLEGRTPDAEAFAAAADAAASAVEAMEDANYSADYRRDLVRTVTYRALESAA